MNAADIARVQTYLRRLFGTDKINVLTPAKPGLSVEVAVEDEVVGTLHRDEDEGEVSFSLNVIILDEDLPPPPKVGAVSKGRAR